MTNRYRVGRIAEKKVSNYLRKKGFTNLRRSAGSRGAYDVYARSPRGDKCYIQVKSGSARVTRDEIKRLRKLAKKRHGVPIVIHRDKKGKCRWSFLGNWSRR